MATEGWSSQSSPAIHAPYSVSPAKATCGLADGSAASPPPLEPSSEGQRSSERQGTPPLAPLHQGMKRARALLYASRVRGPRRPCVLPGARLLAHWRALLCTESGEQLLNYRNLLIAWIVVSSTV